MRFMLKVELNVKWKGL